MSKTILGLDIGYGDVKVIYGTEDGTILKKFKFISAIGITKKNEHVQDKRIYEFKGHNYYVGENATHLPSENRIDIIDYKNLEYYAPLFLYHVIKQINAIPDIVVTGLSKAQITNSGYFQATLKDFEVNGKHFTFENVYVLPQGAGSKITVDKYGTHFPKEQDEFLGNTTFVGCDVGFNTLDMFMVTDGKTSPNLFEGIEKEGVMKIATKVAQKVKEIHDKTIGLHEAKEILDSGVYKLRGKSYSFKEYIEEIKNDYLKELLSLIEHKYGKILDKCDFVFVSGGGSSMFKTTDDGFIRIPEDNWEFYNSLGFLEFGLTKI